MEKIDPQLKVTELDDKVEGKLRAQDVLDGLPQPPTTTPVSTAWSTAGGTKLDSNNTTRLDNMYTRINEIETALVRAGILKSR
jgi:hypothetical protein